MKYSKEILKNQKGLEDSMGQPLKFSKEDFEDMVVNFRFGKVWIPYTHQDASDPRNNTGFVNKVWYDEKRNSLYAVMDVDDEAAEQIDAKKIKHVSVSIRPDEEKGWTLKHVALTLDPALKTQGPFQKLEDGVSRVELSDLEPFVIVNGEKEEIMKDKDKKPDDVVDEDKTKKDGEDINLEEVKGFFAKVRETLNFAGKNVELNTELGKRDTKITELEETVKEGKETVELLVEDKRKRDWDVVFESFIGKRCVPAERELLAERISEPEKLKAELETRVDIGVVEKKTVEAPDGQRDDLLSNLDEDQLEFVKAHGWDQKENVKYLKNYLAQLEEQKD